MKAKKIRLGSLPILVVLLVGMIFINAPEYVGAQDGVDNVKAIDAEVGTAFTYQGRLNDNGNPANGTYDFEFKLYDDVTGGNLVGSTVSLSNIEVNDGYFMVQLNFGNVFKGEQRFLSISIRKNGDGNYVILAPRRAISPVPISINASRVSNLSASDGDPVNALVVDAAGQVGIAKENPGAPLHVYEGETENWNTILVDAAPGKNPNVMFAVDGGQHANIRIDDEGSDHFQFQVYKSSELTPTTAIDIDKKGQVGIATINPNAPLHVYEGETESGHTIQVDAASGKNPNISFTVEGRRLANIRVDDEGEDHFQLQIYNSQVGPGITAIEIDRQANTHIINGVMKASGAFKIDHPLNPTNKYLYHSFVESPDMMNIYNGNVVLDKNGEAWVEMPEWFEALNQEFRYQLTSIGAPGPNLYIAHEIQSNRFQIAGGEANAIVSWQVTGIRHDPYAQQNRIPVEEDKPKAEVGTYLHPEAYGAPRAAGSHYQAPEARNIKSAD